MIDINKFEKLADEIISNVKKDEMKECKCGQPHPQIKVSENGIRSYCTKCAKTFNSKNKLKL